MIKDYLDAAEKAVRNIARGKNAKNYLVGIFQARINKTLLDEDIIPFSLMERGLVRDPNGVKELEAKKHETTSKKPRRK